MVHSHNHGPSSRKSLWNDVMTADCRQLTETNARRENGKWEIGKCGKGKGELFKASLIMKSWVGGSVGLSVGRSVLIPVHGVSLCRAVDICLWFLPKLGKMKMTKVLVLPSWAIYLYLSLAELWFIIFVWNTLHFSTPLWLPNTHDPSHTEMTFPLSHARPSFLRSFCLKHAVFVWLGFILCSSLGNTVNIFNSLPAPEGQRHIQLLS